MVEPSKPNGFCFKANDYWKSCKLQSRCHQHKFMRTLEELDESEKVVSRTPPVQAPNPHGLQPN